MKIDINQFNKLIIDGYVTKQTHPTLPLSIYKYTRKCQYEGHWTKLTRMCRGLIIDDNTNEIIAKPFNKFFNYEEHIQGSIKDDIPSESFEVFEKEDGSLIILTRYRNEIIIATQGSFESDQAIEARNILNEKYNVIEIKEGYTSLFEIHYPENRIVVNHGTDRKLVLLAEINNDTFKEANYIDLIKRAKDIKCPIVKRYNGIIDYKSMREQFNGNNKEGFVIRFKSGFRVKMKYAEYVRLHSILTNISTKIIWEHLRDKKDLNDILLNAPDEFDRWVQSIITALNDLFIVEKDKANEYLKSIHIELSLVNPEYSMKTFALKVQEVVPKKYQGLIFNLHHGKDITGGIWKLIRPVYERPFKIEEK